MTPPKKLLNQVRDGIRLKRYSRSTEKTYVHWIKRFILFHNKRHPLEMGECEIEAFLTDLAVHGEAYRLSLRFYPVVYRLKTPLPKTRRFMLFSFYIAICSTSHPTSIITLAYRRQYAYFPASPIKRDASLYRSLSIHIHPQRIHRFHLLIALLGYYPNTLATFSTSTADDSFYFHLSAASV